MEQVLPGVFPLSPPGHVLSSESNKLLILYSKCALVIAIRPELNLIEYIYIYVQWHVA